MPRRNYERHMVGIPRRGKRLHKTSTKCEAHAELGDFVVDLDSDNGMSKCNQLQGDNPAESKRSQMDIYEIERQYEGAGGGLSAMTSDFVTVMNDIPFSIPPYFALLGRAVATLEDQQTIKAVSWLERLML